MRRMIIEVADAALSCARCERPGVKVVDAAERNNFGGGTRRDHRYPVDVFLCSSWQLPEGWSELRGPPFARPLCPACTARLASITDAFLAEGRP